MKLNAKKKTKVLTDLYGHVCKNMFVLRKNYVYHNQGQI